MSNSLLFPVSRDSAEHYVWGVATGQDCDGWHLVKDTGLSVIEERMPPGGAEVRHFHVRARQFFYVLAGELTMEIDGRERRLEAGSGIEIPPGVAHTAVNASGGDVSFLVVSQPASHGDRVLCR